MIYWGVIAVVKKKNVFLQAINAGKTFGYELCQLLKWP